MTCGPSEDSAADAAEIAQSAPSQGIAAASAAETPRARVPLPRITGVVLLRRPCRLRTTDRVVAIADPAVPACVVPSSAVTRIPSYMCMSSSASSKSLHSLSHASVCCAAGGRVPSTSILSLRPVRTFSLSLSCQQKNPSFCEPSWMSSHWTFVWRALGETSLEDRSRKVCSRRAALFGGASPPGDGHLQAWCEARRRAP